MPETQTEGRDLPDTGAVDVQPPHPSSASHRIVPEAVAGRFLRIDDRYFFPDRTLAFIDHGARLKVRTHNMEVVHSVVAIMEARGWRSVRVSGTTEFRQKLWQEATLRGIGVQGYDPDALEVQQVQRALDRQQTSKLPPDPSLATPLIPPTLPAGERRPHADEKRQRPRDGQRPPIVGVLLAHAAAPYHFDADQRMSYYVRVRTEAGERTVWGADLERAVAESRSNVQPGDEVVLRQSGARPITVRVPERNSAGELVGERKLRTQRMGWTAEKVQFLAALDRKAELLRDTRNNTGDLLAEHPDLAGAVVGLKLAEQFARRLTSRHEDQARLIQAIRSGLADAVARGLQIEPRHRTAPERSSARDHVDAHARTRSRPLPRREVPAPLRD